MRRTRDDGVGLPPADTLSETPDVHGAFPRLTAEQIDALATAGERRGVRRGEILYAQGDRGSDFFVVLRGMVAVIDDLAGEQRVVRVHGPGRFLGELGMIEGQPSFVTAAAADDGEVLVVPLEPLRRLVLSDPVLGDLILRAYLVRRSLLIGLGSGLRVIGSCYSPDTKRLLEFAARNRIPHRLVDLESDRGAEHLLRRLGVGASQTPVVVLPGSGVLHNPSKVELAEKLGLRPSTGDRDVQDLLVVGAGPAGLAAVVYGASDGLAVYGSDALAAGGQAGTTSRIENYLGFPSGISGAELAERSVIQAAKFGVRVAVPVGATRLRPCDGHHVVGFDDGTEVVARSVVIATGARYRRLEVPEIDRFEATSVYYAATLHEARQCIAQVVAVVGGGNSAGQAALFLAEGCPEVHLLVRGEDFGENMSRYLVDRIMRHPKVHVHLHTEVRQIFGHDTVEAVEVEDNHTGARETLGVQGLFVFIGATPHTGWLSGMVALDEDGFVLTGADADGLRTDEPWRHVPRRPMVLETSRPGVFAVGDVRRGSVKRVASAVGEGAMAVHLVHEHLFPELRGAGDSASSAPQLLRT